jgi:holo-[acyl-carrier protein] synthase
VVAVVIRAGIDLVAVDDVRDALDAHGDRYLRRIYTDRELADSSRGGEIAVERLAARFAAKEAVVKALRAPRDEAFGWRAIEVVRDPGGWVDVALTGRASTYADEIGVTELALSLSHDGGYATAIVFASVGE